MKLRSVQKVAGSDSPDFLFWCPGCKCAHGVWTTTPNAITGAKWKVSGPPESPTIQPSIKINPPHACHVVVTDGMLYYCSDSAHEYAGKSIPMQDF